MDDDIPQSQKKYTTRDHELVNKLAKALREGVKSGAVKIQIPKPDGSGYYTPEELEERARENDERKRKETEDLR